MSEAGPDIVFDADRSEALDDDLRFWRDLPGTCEAHRCDGGSKIGVEFRDPKQRLAYCPKHMEKVTGECPEKVVRTRHL